MSESVQPDALDFDRADMTPEAARMSCATCSTPITSTYYGWGASHVCAPCHERLSAEHRKQGSFLRAVVYGAAVAAVGAGVYYGIAALTNMEFGLIAIFVGMGVGKAVRAGAGLESKKRYRALAMFLTYASITATYMPVELYLDEKTMAIAPVLALISPWLLLAKFENIMGLIILGIGVYEAWKLSAAPVISVQGPFMLEPEAPAQPEAAAVSAQATTD